MTESLKCKGLNLLAGATLSVLSAYGVHSLLNATKTQEHAVSQTEVDQSYKSDVFCEKMQDLRSWTAAVGSGKLNRYHKLGVPMVIVKFLTYKNSV